MIELIKFSRCILAEESEVAGFWDWRDGSMVESIGCSLQRTWVQFPAVMGQLTTVCNSRSRVSDILTQTYMKAKYE